MKIKGLKQLNRYLVYVVGRELPLEIRAETVTRDTYGCVIFLINGEEVGAFQNPVAWHKTRL